MFNAPIGDGNMPLIALADLGFFARYTSGHRAETPAKNLEVATELVGWDHLTATFAEVTGKRAEYNCETLDVWFSKMSDVERPVVAEGEPGSTSWRENFTGWWNAYRDDLHPRDITVTLISNPTPLFPSFALRQRSQQRLKA